MYEQFETIKFEGREFALLNEYDFGARLVELS